MQELLSEQLITALEHSIGGRILRRPLSFLLFLLGLRVFYGSCLCYVYANIRNRSRKEEWCWEIAWSLCPYIRTCNILYKRVVTSHIFCVLQLCSKGRRVKQPRMNGMNGTFSHHMPGTRHNFVFSVVVRGFVIKSIFVLYSSTIYVASLFVYHDRRTE